MAAGLLTKLLISIETTQKFQVKTFQLEKISIKYRLNMYIFTCNGYSVYLLYKIHVLNIDIYLYSHTIMHDKEYH